MRTDRRIVRAYLEDYGNWLEKPDDVIGYPTEFKLAVNIYDVFNKPNIKKIYRDVTGHDVPIELDTDYLDREKEYREANYTKTNTPKPKRNPRLPWVDLHTQMNELNKITHRLELRLQIILLRIFKDRDPLDKIAGYLAIEIPTLKDNISEMYDRVAEGIRASSDYKELFYELYRFDQRNTNRLGMPSARKKRKRSLKVPKHVKPNFPSTLRLKRTETLNQ